MPDGADQKKKKSADANAIEPAAAESDFTSEGTPRKTLRLAVILSILAAAVYFGGGEVINRINYVYTEDSRIEADLIIVSSRVAGWVTSLGVTEGSTISAGDVLAAADAVV